MRTLPTLYLLTLCLGLKNILGKTPTVTLVCLDAFQEVLKLLSQS